VHDEPASAGCVSAVVVTWRSGRTIDACLSSLADQVATTVVVDNASPDDTVTRVRQHRSATLIANQANLGLPAANNQGIAATTSEHVLICNPDIEVRPGAVAALVGCLDRHPRAAFAVARLQHEDGSLQTSAGSLPTLREALLGRRFGIRRGTRGAWWHDWDHDDEVRIGRGQEACYLVRRAAIEEVGPQDVRYFLDWEGVDWARRMQERGWELWFCPEARAFHEGGASIKKAPLRWIRNSHRGIYLYFSRDRSLGIRLALAAVVTVRAAVKSAAAVRIGRLYEAGHR
jgi:GT2 family glycosyltransferase